MLASMVKPVRSSTLKSAPRPIRQKSGGDPPKLAGGSSERPVLSAESAYAKSAVAYYRTSSATNVGGEKDSLPRQQDAVKRYAAAQGLEIVREFYDAAVSGTDPVMEREGFVEMLSYMLGNGARIVLVENASRFARHHMVQGMGHELLQKHGITLIPVDAPTQFTEDDPTSNMIRTMISAVSQFEKEALVLKLRKSRDRKSAAAGERVEGSKAWKALRNPEAIVMAREVREREPDLSLRGIAERLAMAGIVSASGKPYGPQSIKRMLRQS